MAYLSPIENIPLYGSSYNARTSPAAASLGLSNTGNPTDARIPEDGKSQKTTARGTEDPTQECQTCKNRKYVDGSNEMVSFKSPTHVSPESAGAAVRAHEQEHVSNAYSKAANSNGKVLQASVSIHMSVCPECGRSYVAGGTTHTQIKYYNEDNPYQKDLKSADSIKYKGMNTDYGV